MSEQNDIIELCEAAAAMRNACNHLWWAHNPDEAPAGVREEVPTVEYAEEKHSDAFQRLARAEYYVRKRFGLLK